MSEKRFRYGETVLFEWVEDNGKIISTKECVNKLNEQQATINNFEKLFSETICVADTSKLLETGDYEIKRMVVKELIENLQKENDELKELVDSLRQMLDEELKKITERKMRK